MYLAAKDQTKVIFSGLFDCLIEFFMKPEMLHCFCWVWEQAMFRAASKDY